MRRVQEDPPTLEMITACALENGLFKLVWQSVRLAFQCTNHTCSVYSILLCVKSGEMSELLGTPYEQRAFA